MSNAAMQQKPRSEYHKHGDIYRQRLLKERGVDAIDGRSRDSKQAKTWRNYALQRKGGKSCTVDVKAKIEAGTFYLWRALCLRSYIVADAKGRGTQINKRRGVLPAINEQYDIRLCSHRPRTKAA